ncbi:peroxiredoxin family protein [Limnochorda pilosa]|uniref:Thiol-disulfide oxidoreductase n=1 Tax=Limnochorda pilosa TaxID=1555112 RepID=A0A0K2SNH9_LIMPI|nr:redoxin domain-containing protein [Limnochorda pilosa]BAS28572.1 thiol-disulfide oxidoreductase [Limnochorda pilosa]
MRMRAAEGAHLACLVLIATLAWSLTSARALAIGVEAGAPAPSVVLETLDGQVLSSDTLYRSPLALVFFFAECPPCQVELPALQSTYAEWRRKGGEALAVTAISSGTAVQSFVDEHGIQFPVALDPEGTVTRTFGVTKHPTLFFIDETGVIQRTWEGYHEGIASELLTELIAGSE